MADRVVLFIDYQNAYRGARTAFHEMYAPFWEGQPNPTALGLLVTRLSPWPRDLTQVRIYRGLPDSTRDPKGYGAARRQIDAWRKLPLVHATYRPLRYPANYPTEKPEEKGIDVQLAIDFVMMAVRNEFDVGVLMSADTDMKPALEAVAGLSSGPRVEVAAWKPISGHGRRLSIGSRQLWCHWIDETMYRSIQDQTDYTSAS